MGGCEFGSAEGQAFDARKAGDKLCRMGMSNSVQQMRENFEAQFEAAGEDRFLYRRNQKGEPIPISADERECFIRQYVRHIWFVLGGMMTVLAAFWGLVIWWTVSADKDFPDITMYVGTATIAVAAIALMYWVRNAPARELEGRTPIGRERTSEEMRALYLSRTSYAQLAFTGGFGAFLIVIRALNGRRDSGLHWFYLVAGAGLVVFAGIRAFQKWRYDSEHPSDLI